MKYLAFSAILCITVLFLFVLAHTDTNQSPKQLKRTRMEHRSFSVFDASYQDRFPCEKWKIRDRSLILKYQEVL